MHRHLPRTIRQTFSGQTEASERKNPERAAGLYLPEAGNGTYPLIVRVTDGEEISRELAWMNGEGYAVYRCFADQAAMERDPQACAAWLAELEDRVDQLLQENPGLNPRCVFLDGWFTAYAVFHTRRFRAAIQRPALINPSTAYGNCAAGWVEPFGDSLEDMMRRLAEQSVLADVDACETPCLVLYKEGDPRYSREQSEQFYAAMKDRNPRVPCRMAVFPDADTPAWETRWYREMTDWWKRFSEEDPGGAE